MSVTGRRTPAADTRNIEPGLLLLGAGAILLFVSLFLLWYRPNLDAWTAFEAWDLVLAATAVLALVAVAGRMGYGAPRPDAWLIGAAGVALVVVLSQLINPPPTAGLQDGIGTGLWLALAGSVLMALGAMSLVARISVALNRAGAHPVGPQAAAPVTPGLGGEPVRPRERFVAGPGPADDPSYAEAPPAQRAPTAPTRPV